jgi:hypothetical protein
MWIKKGVKMKCPNGEAHKVDTISETEGYCNDCDITIKFEKGKTKADPGSGRLTRIEQELEKIKANQQVQARDLYGNESPLPFID